MGTVADLVRESELFSHGNRYSNSCLQVHCPLAFSALHWKGALPWMPLNLPVPPVIWFMPLSSPAGVSEPDQLVNILSPSASPQAHEPCEVPAPLMISRV